MGQQKAVKHSLNFDSFLEDRFLGDEDKWLMKIFSIGENFGIRMIMKHLSKCYPLIIVQVLRNPKL